MNKSKRMLESSYLTYNGIGLLVEIFGLIMLLVPEKISFFVRPHSEYRIDGNVYPIGRSRIVNDSATSGQAVLRTSQVGILVIVSGLAFQFIAMF